jgi:curved DNA-binding protein CbpA
MLSSPTERLRTYYELLGIPATAAAEAIKSAFRKEIARCHPDKVHHLGPQFQEVASSRAAGLTAAYRILMDPAARAAYDTSLANAVRATPMPHPSVSARPAPVQQSQRPAAPAGRAPNAVPKGFDKTRASVSASVHKATIDRICGVIQGLSGTVEPSAEGGFDAAYVLRPRRLLFHRFEPPIHLRVKIVDEVDPSAVAAIWPLVTRIANADVTPCVLLCGPGLAPARDLAASIAGQRRKHRQTAGPVVIPVDTRDWQALIPSNTPGLVRKLIERLKLGV